MTIYSVWSGCTTESACLSGGCIGKCLPCLSRGVPPVQSARDDGPHPQWLIEGKRATPLGSARDHAESNCCGKAPGSCSDCPLIVQPLLTANSAERKATPITTGVLDYFPLALAALARLSKKGNDKHNPGEPLHWAREKSTDHADCVGRHLIERGTIEPESGELHEICLLWRAAALAQIAEEKRLAIKAAGV